MITSIKSTGIYRKHFQFARQSPAFNTQWMTYIANCLNTATTVISYNQLKYIITHSSSRFPDTGFQVMHCSCKNCVKNKQKCRRMRPILAILGLELLTTSRNSFLNRIPVKKRQKTITVSCQTNGVGEFNAFTYSKCNRKSGTQYP